MFLNRTRNSLPIWVRVTFALGRWLANFRGVKSTFVSGPDGRVHHFRIQNAATSRQLVLIHGLGSGATPYTPLMSALRPWFGEIFAPEFPGHGCSGPAARDLSAENLFDYIERTLSAENAPFWLYGNSLGGAMAIRYAYRHPDRVRGLILSSPAGAYLDDQEIASLKAQFRVGDKASSDRFMMLLFGKRPRAAALIRRLIGEVIRRPEIQEFLEKLCAGDGLSEDEIRAVKCPVLLLWGERERLFPRSALEWFRRLLPAGSVVLEPRGFAHSPQLDHTKVLVSLISDFVEKADAVSPPTPDQRL